MEKFVLPPGFRFHPTDEELLSHYLRRKVCGRKLDFEAIAEVDLYKYEPWDLPEKSFLQTRDLEWYFFIPRDKKYPNGSRTNRATEKGYWKSTGKDRFIPSGSRNVGTKKTLVYYNGRAPKGERSNWVMHEYRLNDAECQRVNALENGFVLCRIYQKSGAGPKNGEQYGAPVEDEEFEGSLAVEGDGSAFLKAGLFEAGPSSASASGSGKEAVSHEVNRQFASSDIQPRILKFADSPGNMSSDFLQKENFTNHFVTGSTVLPAYGGEDSVAPVGHEEENILRELYKLVTPGASADQLESTDGYQDPTTCVVTGFYQPGALPPSDGDFLELNDLLSVSDCEDGIEAKQSNKMQTNGGLKDFSGESECPSILQLQAVPGQWQHLPFEDGMHEILPESMQMQSSVSTVTYDSQYQDFSDNLLESLIPSSGLYNEELGAASQTDLREADYEDVLEFFARASEEKSFNVESFAENIQRGLFHSEDNFTIPSQDGHYYDALLSFTDMDMYGETKPTAMHTASNFGTPQLTLAQSEGVAEAHDFVTESVLSSQGAGSTLGQVKNPPSPLSIIWSCLDSLPTLPASAADLSPKAVSPEVNNTGRFVKSLSFVGQRRKPSDKWRIGYYTSAIFGGLWAVFWLLIAGGAWKLFGGVYRRMVGSET